MKHNLNLLTTFDAFNLQLVFSKVYIQSPEIIGFCQPQINAFGNNCHRV